MFAASRDRTLPSAARSLLLLVLLGTLCAPAGAQAAGTITVTAGAVRSATDTDSGYADALDGVTFQKADWVSDSATASWSTLCTTGTPTGACTSPSLNNGRYLVRQSPGGAPSGWRALTHVAWGGGSSGASPTRGYVGDVSVSNGSNVTVRPSTEWSPTGLSTASGRFVAAKSNPALPERCGLDVLLLLDRSGSITAQESTYRAAAKQFVSTLNGTPTRLKIFSFAEDARADQSTFLGLENPGSATTANTKIDDVYGDTGGATNWDAGMSLAAGAGVDVVVFITDGNPTVRDTSSGTSSSTVDLLDLTFGVASANKVKTQGKSASAGATILAVGAGTGVTAENLAAVSGPTAGIDYVTSDVAGLGTKLQQIANQLCGARIHVRKLADAGDPAVAKAGWTFTPGKPLSSTVTFAPAGPVTTAGTPAEAVIAVDKIPAAGASAITVAETQQAGYAFVASECRTGGYADVTSGGMATATIPMVRRNEDWYCTFRNSHTGKLIIEKQTLPNGDPASFDFTTTATGAGTFSLTDGGTVTRDVVPGTYTATEAAKAGWTLSDLDCDDADSTIAARTATFRVGPGETVRCTFTNTKDGRLIVEEQTLPNGDPASFDFTTTATGAGAFSLTDGGTVTRDLQPGTYTATQAVKAGWALSDLDCDDADSTTAGRVATFRVGPGETVRCTFTNTKDGKVVVEKQTLPNGDPASFDFTTTATGAGTFSLTDGGTVTRDVVPGTYTATEAAKSGWTLSDLACNDGDSTTAARTATFRVAPGETVTCVFTNTKDGKVVVEKQTLPNGDPASFDFTTTATGAGTFSLTDGGQVTRDVVPGTYTATEAVKAGWALSDLDCDDADSTIAARTATFRVGPGETVRCTFTNTRDGRLIVEEQTLPNGDPASFDFTTTATGAGAFSLTGGGTVTRDVVPGTYTATEAAKAGWSLSDLDCDDADSTTAGRTATFRVAPGETVTCVFTNTRDGRLIIEKQTLPNGDPASFDFTTTATGAATFSLTDGGTQARDVVPGTYTATESTKAGWALTDLDCDDNDSTTAGRTATFRVAPGETVACTFTNTKDGKLIVEEQTLPNSDAASFDFTTTATGAGTFSLTDGGTVTRDLQPGTYTATQAVKAGWALSDLDCDDGDSTHRGSHSDVPGGPGRDRDLRLHQHEGRQAHRREADAPRRRPPPVRLHDQRHRFGHLLAGRWRDRVA